MRTKTSTILLAGCLTVILLAGAFSGGIFVGLALPRGNTPVVQAQPVVTSPTDLPFKGTTTALPFNVTATPVPTTSISSVTPQDLQQLFQPFWQSWDLVHKEYVDQPVDDTKLMQGAIKGMLDSLGDVHTSYMDPNLFKQEMTDLTGQQYEGIGAWVDATGSYLKIVSPMPNSPALKAGLKPGDIVIAVDKQDMTGTPGDSVLKKVLGPAGTNVTLTIQRGTQDPFDVTITRAKIDVPQADWRMEANNVAYVHLFIYGDQTATELHKALAELLPKKPVGLILDLRNNGGGFLDSAINVLSEFVPQDQVVMLEQYGTGQTIQYKSHGGGSAQNIPIVVLMNEGTASASEITAGALQDLGLAKLVGVKSYGKGSVQQVTTLPNNQGGLRITVARWLTPKGRQINGVGLTPDFEVKLTQDDINAGKDPQLQKAIELLSTK
jgi:carboxyl-terminal processing protease